MKNYRYNQPKAKSIQSIYLYNDEQFVLSIYYFEIHKEFGEIVFDVHFSLFLWIFRVIDLGPFSHVLIESYSQPISYELLISINANNRFIENTRARHYG